MIEVKRSVAGEAVLNEAMTVPRSQDRGEDRTQDRGQDEVLEDLVRQHSRLVYRIAYAALRSHHDAEDATQETFLRVLRYSPRLAAVENPKTWLARIAWRVAVARSQQRGRRQEIALERPEDPTEEARSSHAPADQAIHSTQVNARPGTADRDVAEELARPADPLRSRRNVAARSGHNAKRQRSRRAVPSLPRQTDIEGKAGRRPNRSSRSQNMMDNNRRQEDMHRQSLENDKLDRELDAALAKYAAAEPRAGLEERVLATLRAEPEHATSHAWWRWPALGALAAAIVVIASVAWRSARPVQSETAHPPAMTEIVRDSKTMVAKKNGTGSIRPHKAGSYAQLDTHAVTREAPVVAPSPKLDHFPSPQPLSEQEAILARYITNYPEHAALIAQARTEALRQDRAEEMREAASPQDSRR